MPENQTPNGQRSLDEALNVCLQKAADKWSYPLHRVIEETNAEIGDRAKAYQLLAKALRAEPLSLDNVANAAIACPLIQWRERQDCRDFLTNEQTRAPLRDLIAGASASRDETIRWIDSFVDQAIQAGLSRPIAALLASTILTAAIPERFIAYRHRHWKRLAERLAHACPRGEATTAEWITWAGKFASLIAETNLVDRYWPSTNPSFATRLWVVSGLCWEWNSLDSTPVPRNGNEYDRLRAALRQAGLYFPDEVLSNYLLALQTRRFVILSGISGTGKTELARCVAKHFCTGREDAVCTIAVRPDWTDNRGLLGYLNPITDRYTTTPLLDLLLRAGENAPAHKKTEPKPDPFFVILDEMNLAHVEHYFSDFLSCLESGEEIELHSVKDGALRAGDEAPEHPDNKIPPRLRIPENVFFTGTVNVDETTYMFSPKVVDRAFTLELNEVNLQALCPSDKEAAITDDSEIELSGLPAHLEWQKPGRADWEKFCGLLGGKFRDTIQALHELLEKDHRHFGYRVALEIARFVCLAAEQAGKDEGTLWAALDLAILQKVLPKFHGTRQELEEPLRNLLVFAVTLNKPDDGSRKKAEEWERLQERERGPQTTTTASIPDSPASEGGQGASPKAEASPEAKLHRTACKVHRMLRQLERQGFAAYME